MLQRLEVEALEHRVRGLLGSVPPRATEFAARVDAVLNSERNWVRLAGCSLQGCLLQGSGFRVQGSGFRVRVE